MRKLEVADPDARRNVVAASKFLARNGLLVRNVDDGFFGFK
jgi:hypothetical protein